MRPCGFATYRKMGFLPSFCDEGCQGDFDFIDVEDAVAVLVIADADRYLSKVEALGAVKHSTQI